MGKRAPKRAELGEISEVLDVMTLLSLPDHLRKSALTIVKLGKAMAEDVAKETGRARAIESAYLNQLVRMGYLRRVREGKRVYFWAEAVPSKAEASRVTGKGGST
ncbi:MAG: transcriptional regulator [Candidatus Hadarchaeaceae archaeon]